jgi:hypothetical protein
MIGTRCLRLYLVESNLSGRLCGQTRPYHVRDLISPAALTAFKHSEKPLHFPDIAVGYRVSLPSKAASSWKAMYIKSARLLGIFDIIPWNKACLIIEISLSQFGFDLSWRSSFVPFKCGVLKCILQSVLAQNFRATNSSRTWQRTVASYGPLLTSICTSLKWALLLRSTAARSVGGCENWLACAF